MKKYTTIFAGFFFVFLYQNVETLPAIRAKRVSDQRLAELETLLALTKIRGKMVTVPAYLRKIDPIYVAKRVSDQRLAELKTLLALSEIRGKMVSVPAYLRKIDPTYIGRKRRSNSKMSSLPLFDPYDKD